MILGTETTGEIHAVMTMTPEVGDPAPQTAGTALVAPAPVPDPERGIEVVAEVVGVKKLSVFADPR